MFVCIYIYIYMCVCINILNTDFEISFGGCIAYLISHNGEIDLICLVDILYIFYIHMFVYTLYVYVHIIIKLAYIHRSTEQ